MLLQEVVGVCGLRVGPLLHLPKVASVQVFNWELMKYDSLGYVEAVCVCVSVSKEERKKTTQVSRKASGAPQITHKKKNLIKSPDITAVLTVKTIMRSSDRIFQFFIFSRVIIR